MSWPAVTAEHVRRAIAECNKLGHVDFRRKYGFGEALVYDLVYERHRYDSKAILGVAYIFANGERPRHYSGGAATVVPRLRKLGFTVENRHVSEPSGWADAEIQPTVTAYFAMLQAELADQPYVKADFNREVQAATGRSHGAVEYKFQNISAVLRDLGLPYVLGYQPLPNLQNALRSEVERFLARDPEIQRLIDKMPTPDVPPTARLVEVDPPVMAPPGTSGHSRTTIGVDYLERQARNRDIGLKGEHLVVEHERAWLSAHGHPDLAERVAHIPSTLGDGAGYDVSSFFPDGTPHHIEVKATRGSITAPFFLSATELRHAREHPVGYSIYRIFDLGPNPRFYKLTGDMDEILDLKPVSYQARVKSP
jgi:Domain of unknown function (DUF3883)